MQTGALVAVKKIKIVDSKEVRGGDEPLQAAATRTLLWPRILRWCDWGRLVRLHVVCVPQGINVTALREIKILKELRGHPNIVSMLDAWTLKKNILLVRLGPLL